MKQEINNFLNDNALYFALAIIALLVIVLVIAFISSKKKSSN